MKPGPKPRTPAMAVAAGETRPSRQVVNMFPDHASRPDPDHISAPKWLSAAAKRIWNDKVTRYRQRNQKVDGFQDALAQYCAIEADIIKDRKRGVPIPVSLINAFRAFAAEFYDTPASQVAKPGGSSSAGGRFNRTGKPPAKD